MKCKNCQEEIAGDWAFPIIKTGGQTTRALGGGPMYVLGHICPPCFSQLLEELQDTNKVLKSVGGRFIKDKLEVRDKDEK